MAGAGAGGPAGSRYGSLSALSTFREQAGSRSAAGSNGPRRHRQAGPIVEAVNPMLQAAGGWTIHEGGFAMISRFLPVLAVAAQRLVLPRVEKASHELTDRWRASHGVEARRDRRAGCGAPPASPRPPAPRTEPQRMTEREVWDRYDMLMVSLMLPPMMN
jgi:hypothetical protein